MANEIRATVSLSCNNGNLTFNKSYSIAANQVTARGPNPGTISVTTTDTTVNFGALGTPRWALFRNIGTNAVNVGAGTSIVSFMQMNAGDVALMPLMPSATIRVQAITGTSSLHIEALDT